MSEHQHSGPVHDPHSAAGWEARYADEPVWSGNPNGALVAEVTGMTPGRALDVGCGEGADAVWLAEHGWEVTALDIAGNAVHRTLAAARERGQQVGGVIAPFAEALLDGPYDLVSCQYPVLARTADGSTEEKLLDLVAPGGTLLFVHHADIDPEHARAGGWDPEAFLQPADVAALVSAHPQFTLEREERRDRHVSSGNGAGHHVDLVVRARRLPA
ncbi:class I SAM-dependent methyltransferase [Luteococcus peritonei]|uniref:Class I SAM-dependent methyltransferase n=1 Tax=Luteococcus peritonei TaxID=88874 RepID=A0ABW4RT87_9ACTN